MKKYKTTRAYSEDNITRHDLTLTTLDLCPLISIIWVHLQSEQSELILILKLAPLTPCCLIPWS